MTPLIIVSCDGHAAAPVETYREYLDAKYRHLLPELAEEEKGHLGMKQLFGFLEDPQRLAAVDERNRILSGGYAGGWDAGRRLKELDAEGIAAEVILPLTGEAITPFFHSANRPHPADVRIAGLRAYHRWLADMMTPAKGRLIGTALTDPVMQADEMLEELRYVAQRGFRGVYLPGWMKDSASRPLYEPQYESFWAACSDLDLVLIIHAGYGQGQGELQQVMAEVDRLRRSGEAAEGFIEAMTSVMAKLDENQAGSIFAPELTPRQALWQLIFGGVFDRYPNLKLSIAECRADWVPEAKAQLDKHFLTADKRPRTKLKPSEYFGRNVYITPSSPRRSEIEIRHEIGVDNWMFGADYPHPEGTWPNTLAWLRAVFFDVPENELRAMLGENAIKVYGLDKNWLSGIAAKIGPKPSDIIGNYKVDERVIADFNLRSNFSTRAPMLDPQLMDRKLREDLAAAAS